MSAHVELRGSAPSVTRIVRRSENTPSFRRWLRAVVRSWQRRKMVAALSSLDDRMLWDIGIHRGEIQRLVDRFDDHELQMAPVAPDAGLLEDAEQNSFRSAV